MPLATDIISRAEELDTIRQPWHSTWLDTVRYGLPLGDRHFDKGLRTLDKHTLGPKSNERGRDIYDATSVSAIDRLTSGMESLTTPAAEKWHGLQKTDPFAVEATDEEQEWFDMYRDYLFGARYNPKAGFSLANQLAIRSTIALGTGVYLVEENFKGNARQEPFRYRNIPLSECYLAVNSEGMTDTNYRRMNMTARQMIQKFGEENVHEQIRKDADSTDNKENRHEVIHAVFPREERGSSRNTNRDSEYASIHVDVANRHMIGESGFFEFPYVVYYWQQNPDTAYGESPVMLALAEIKSLNLLAKNTLRAVQQWTNPPVGVAHDGVTAMKVNLNPGKVNPGAVDENGRLRIQPIVTAQSPNFIQQVMELKRDQVKETLFVNLFQILVNNPQMTATEALLRANEKGELLGPAGAKIQTGLAHMLDRETAILTRKGAFESGSPLEPPESLRDEGFGARFTAPLDRLRRGNELVAIQRTYEFAGQLAQIDPGVLDKLDSDEALDMAQEINGAPRKIFRTDEEVEQRREERAQAEAQAAQIEAARAAGEAGNEAIPALREGADLLNQFAEAQDQG